MRPYPIRERGGAIWAWYHATDGEPFYELPLVPEMDDAAWTKPMVREFTISTSCQEMAENNHDFAHFQYVHGTETIPDGEEVVDGTYKSVKNPGLERETFGLGLGVVRVPGMLTFVSSTTPIDERSVHVRWFFAVPVESGQKGLDFFAEQFSRCHPGHPDLGEQDLPLPARADQERSRDHRPPQLVSSVPQRRGLALAQGRRDCRRYAISPRSNARSLMPRATAAPAGRPQGAPMVTAERLAKILPIIDLDAHVVEPPDTWTSRLPARYRDVGTRVELLPAGTPKLVGASYLESPGTEGPPIAWWHYEDQLISVKRTIAAAGYPADEVELKSVSYDDMRPGCWQPAARLADMDLNGVEAQLCFPNLSRFCGQLFLWGKDKALADVCVRADNDWMVDECGGSSGGRLLPLCLVPLWDPDLAWS